MSGLRILPKGLLAPFPPQDTTVTAEMPKQRLSLQPTTSRLLKNSGSRRVEWFSRGRLTPPNAQTNACGALARDVFFERFAAVALKLVFQQPARSSGTASGGSARVDSSRRKSRISVMASRRLSRHDSRVRPWPLAPGTSAQQAINQGPSCSTIAVNSLRTNPV